MFGLYQASGEDMALVHLEDSLNETQRYQLASFESDDSAILDFTVTDEATVMINMSGQKDGNDFYLPLLTIQKRTGL